MDVLEWQSGIEVEGAFVWRVESGSLACPPQWSLEELATSDREILAA